VVDVSSEHSDAESGGEERYEALADSLNETE